MSDRDWEKMSFDEVMKANPAGFGRPQRRDIHRALRFFFGEAKFFIDFWTAPSGTPYEERYPPKKGFRKTWRGPGKNPTEDKFEDLDRLITDLCKAKPGEWGKEAQALLESIEYFNSYWFKRIPPPLEKTSSQKKTLHFTTGAYSAVSVSKGLEPERISEPVVVNSVKTPISFPKPALLFSPQKKIEQDLDLLLGSLKKGEILGAEKPLELVGEKSPQRVIMDEMDSLLLGLQRRLIFDRPSGSVLAAEEVPSVSPVSSPFEDNPGPVSNLQPLDRCTFMLKACDSSELVARATDDLVEPGQPVSSPLLSAMSESESDDGGYSSEVAGTDPDPEETEAFLGAFYPLSEKAGVLGVEIPDGPSDGETTSPSSTSSSGGAPNPNALRKDELPQHWHQRIREAEPLPGEREYGDTPTPPSESPGVHTLGDAFFPSSRDDFDPHRDSYDDPPPFCSSRDAFDPDRDAYDSPCGGEYGREDSMEDEVDQIRMNILNGDY